MKLTEFIKDLEGELANRKVEREHLEASEQWSDLDWMEGSVETMELIINKLKEIEGDK